MMRIIIGVGIVGLGLLIYSLIECLQTPRHRIRVMPKTAWIAVIVLLPIIGAGLWLGFGRVREPKQGGQAPRRPRSPDDDPDFLRQVEIQRRHRQRAEEQRQQERERARRKKETEARTGSEHERQLGEAADAAASGEGAAEATESENTEAEGTEPESPQSPRDPDVPRAAGPGGADSSEDDGEPGASRPESGA